jgi:hypothetical protein
MRPPDASRPCSRRRRTRTSPGRRTPNDAPTQPSRATSALSMSTARIDERAGIAGLARSGAVRTARRKQTTESEKIPLVRRRLGVYPGCLPLGAAQHATAKDCTTWRDLLTPASATAAFDSLRADIGSRVRPLEVHARLSTGAPMFAPEGRARAGLSLNAQGVAVKLVRVRATQRIYRPKATTKIHVTQP